MDLLGFWMGNAGSGNANCIVYLLSPIYCLLGAVCISWGVACFCFCGGAPAAASDTADTLPFDVAAAATPSYVDSVTALSPQHDAQAKRQVFSQKPANPAQPKVPDEGSGADGVKPTKAAHAPPENKPPKDPKNEEEFTSSDHEAGSGNM